MSKERFEVFGNVIKDNEDIPSLLNNYQATVRLNELNDRIKELEQELDTWKRACELACEREDDCYVYDNIHRAYEFYQQAKKEGEKNNV